MFLHYGQNPAKVLAFLKVKACKCHFKFFSVSSGSGAVNLFLPPVQLASQVTPLKSPSTTIPPVPLTPASPPAQSEVLWLSLQEGETSYCSHISLSLTSSCSHLPSLQNSVPWDPSAPLLKGTSDTYGNQEWIKCSVSASVSEKWQCVMSWRMEAMPQAPTSVLELWTYMTSEAFFGFFGFFPPLQQHVYGFHAETDTKACWYQAVLMAWRSCQVKILID